MMSYPFGMVMDWTLEEDRILLDGLENGLMKFTTDQRISCYAKIAKQLENKTIRDVARRTVWLMKKKEQNKMIKEEHNGFDLDHKETIDMLASQSVPKSFIDVYNQNELLLKHIYSNLQPSKAHENLTVFSKCTPNFEKLTTNVDEDKITMGPMPQNPQLPQLPERLSDDRIEKIIEYFKQHQI